MNQHNILQTSSEKRIKDLIKNILEHYVELEGQSNNKILYYCHNEFDSNVTEFEGLSNCNKIVLKSKLSKKYIPIIMLIFQAIYDDNYYMFEDTSFASSLYYDLDIEATEEMYKDLMSYENTNSWLELLKLYSESHDIEYRFVGNERCYESLPMVEDDYYRSNKKQKIYTISTIKNLLNK